MNTATGDFYETSTDLKVPGPGIPLAYTRTYDAEAAQAEVGLGESVPPLGYGWSTPFDMNISVSADTVAGSGLISPVPLSAVVTEENGAQTTFAPYVSGSSPAWCSAFMDFCSTNPMVQATLNENADGSWTYTRTLKGTTTFNFGVANPTTGISTLVGMSDAIGNTLASANYVPVPGQQVCPSGSTCVAWTSSADGGVLVIATSATGNVTQVFNPASGQTVHYAYTGSGCSTWSGANPIDLCSVTDPAGIVSSYAYDTAAPMPYSYDLTAFTPSGGSALTTNAYNASGQVVTQTDPTGEITSYAYSLAGTMPSAAQSTTVTAYPKGISGPSDVTTDNYLTGSLVSEDNGSSTVTYVRDPTTLMPTQATVAPDAGLSGNSRATTYTLDSNGNILTTTDPVGNVTANEYTPSDLVWCTISPAEHLVSTTTCPSSAPSAPPASGTDPWPGATVSALNGAGQVLSTTDALGNTTIFAYTSTGGSVPPGLLYCTVDAANYAAGVTCPSYAAATANPPLGATVARYNASGQLIAQTAPSGGMSSFTFGANGLIAAATDPLGEVTKYSYDGDGRITATNLYASATASAPLSTAVNAYDSAGRLVCQISALSVSQGTSSCVAPASMSPASPQPGVTSYFYDAAGRLVQSTNPIGGTTLSAYDQAGERYCSISATAFAQELQATHVAPSCPAPTSSAPLGATWTTYDSSGRVSSVTNPLGAVTSYGDDAFGDVITQTVTSNDTTNDPPVTTVKAYDGDGRVTSSTVAPSTSQAATTLNLYDPNGDPYCQVSPNAVAQGFSTSDCPTWQNSWINSPPSAATLYVAAPATPSSSQAEDVTTTFANDNGIVVQSSDARGSTTVTVPDALGRTACAISAPDLATYLGLSTTTGSAANYPYNCPGAPGVTNVPPSPGSGSATGYTMTWRDQAGDVTATTDPLGSTSTATFDVAGNQLASTNPDRAVTTDCYYYEACAGAAASIGYSGAPSERYYEDSPPTQQSGSGIFTFSDYNPGGKLRTTSVLGTSNATAYTYDANGDVTQESYSNPLPGYAAVTTPTTYQYNGDGTRAQMTDANGTSTYTYNALRELTSTNSAVAPYLTAPTSYTYFTTGVRATMTNPPQGFFPGPVVTYTYDATGAVASEAVGTGATPVQFTHDPNGNLTSTIYPNGDTVTNSFDAANGETNVSLAPTGSPQATMLSYATPRGAGEMVASETDTGAGTTPNTQTYTYSPDVQLGKVNNASASYDPANQLTQAPGRDYTQCFDAAGELTATKAGSCATGVTTSTLTYDATGDRVAEGPVSNGTAGAAPAGGSPTSPGSETYNQLGQLVSETPAPMTSGGSANTSTYYPITPVRVCDTRSGNPSGLSGTALANCSGKTLPASGPIAVQLSGAAMPAPTGATAVVLAITGVNSGSSTTTVAATPYGSTGNSSTTNLTVSGGQTTTTQITVGTGPEAGNAAITLSATGTAATDVTVDVVGYFTVAGPGTTGGSYYSTVGTRICDTRGSSGLGSTYDQCNKTTADKAIGAGKTLTVTGGSSKMVVPLGATAIVADVTAIAPTANTSLTVYADGGALPATKMLNAGAGVTTTQEVTIPLNTTTGKFVIYNAAGSTDVTVDVVGFYDSTVLNQFAPVTPGRICDTQSTESGQLNGSSAQCTNQTLSAGGTLQFEAHDLATIPVRATGVVLSVTATPLNSTDSGSLTIYQATSRRPSTTALSFSGGTAVTSEETVSIVPGVSPTVGLVAVAANGAGANIQVDVLGYYLSPSAITGTNYFYNGDGLRTANAQGAQGSLQTFIYDTTQPNTPIISDPSNWYVYGPAGELVASGNYSSGTNYEVTDQLGSVRAVLNASGTVIGTQNYDTFGNVTSTFGTMSPIGFAGGRIPIVEPPAMRVLPVVG